jgi:hypothetical protein
VSKERVLIVQWMGLGVCGACLCCGGADIVCAEVDVSNFFLKSEGKGNSRFIIVSRGRKTEQETEQGLKFKEKAKAPFLQQVRGCEQDQKVAKRGNETPTLLTTSKKLAFSSIKPLSCHKTRTKESKGISITLLLPFPLKKINISLAPFNDIV